MPEMIVTYKARVFVRNGHHHFSLMTIIFISITRIIHLQEAMKLEKRSWYLITPYMKNMSEGRRDERPRESADNNICSGM